MSSIVFLGTGPGSPVKGKFSSSCLLRAPSATVLVDTGEPCSLSLCNLGVRVSDIDAVLITHGHSDHTAGLPMLLQAAWLEKRPRPLPVFLPDELIGPLKAWLGAVFLPEKLLGFPLEFRAWKVGRPENVAPGVEVAPFATTHLDGLRRIIEPGASHRFKTFGFDIRCDGKRAVFSSDLGTPLDLGDVLARPCDVLVCELSHYEPGELFAFLRGRKIGVLALNHFSPALAGREQEIAEMARRELPGVGRTVAVRDGDVVEF